MDVLGLVDLPWYMLVIGILLLNTFIAYKYFTWRFNELGELGIKHPKPIPVLGNMMTIMKHGFRYGEVKLVREYGKLFGIYEGRNPLIIVSDTDMVKQILIGDFASFVDRRRQDFQADVLKLSLTDVNGEHWRHIRRFVTPAFSSGKMRQMSPQLTLAADHLLENLVKHEQEEKDIDMKQVCGSFVMEVVCSTAFGLQLNTQTEKNHPFLENVKRAFDLGLTNIAILIALFIPCLVPVFEYFGLAMFDKKAINYFAKVVEDTLEHRRKVPTNRPDFIQLMVDAEKDHLKNEEISSNGENSHARDDYRKHKGLTTEEIMAQSVLFMVAGYETTATTLHLLLYNLAVHPDAQDKVIAEMDEHLPGDTEPHYDNIAKLAYLEQCVNETLRLYPPASRTERVAVQDTVVNGVKFPKGILVSIPILAMHTDPEVWPDPDKFDPDRFTPEAKANRHPCNFMPFGMGPRNCVGMRFAEMELKISAVKILQKFRMVPCEKTQVPLKMKELAFFADPEQPIFLRVKSRLH